ncbi:DUF2071 domain-containing protein [Solibacillus sp. CAU 1738]|uniref:YqjF family protein n=1 Tax=Solibacillus sp. CAU 1738 TaxID=3140363 RepID=UPI00326192D0
MKEDLKAKWMVHHSGCPIPNLPWVMKQTWSDLLFAHYPVKLELLQKHVPTVLPLDSYNGTGWIGIVPFFVNNQRVRLFPPIYGTNRFLQLNLRTYVTINGKRGIYFIRIDMNNLLAGVLAKTFYYMPIQAATIKMKQDEQHIDFSSKRHNVDEFEFHCRYSPITQPFYAAKESFEQWLFERYSLFSLNRRGEVVRCDILHDYWPLQHAEGEIYNNSILFNEGIQVASNEPVLHYANKMEALLWPIMRVENQ